MIRACLTAIFCAGLIGGSVAAAAGQEKEIEIRVVIGDSTPRYHACFENASAGLSTLEALSPCDYALDNEPLSDHKIAVAHANRGVIQYNIGDYEAAIADFSEALDRNIHVEAKVLTNRGMAYEALSADSLARADYAAALAINPKYSAAKRRFEELSKPIYERSRLPKRITAEAAPKAQI